MNPATRLRRPAAQVLFAYAKGDFVWFIELDDFDVPFLVEYRIVGG